MVGGRRGEDGDGAKVYLGTRVPTETRGASVMQSGHCGVARSGTRRRGFVPGRVTMQGYAFSRNRGPRLYYRYSGSRVEWCCTVL